MENNSITTILETENKKLKEEYIKLLMYQFTYSTMNLEIGSKILNDKEGMTRLSDNMRAFKYLLENLQQKHHLTEEKIIMVGDMVNESAPYISRGYRSRGDYSEQMDLPISNAIDISKNIKETLAQYQYNKEVEEIDIFVCEATFHINFIRIHPFEDGNHRTGRLLLNYNLLKERIAPVIIPNELIAYYLECIRSKDIEGMASLFFMQSKKEQVVVEKFIKEKIPKNTQAISNIPIRRK